MRLSVTSRVVVVLVAFLLLVSGAVLLSRRTPGVTTSSDKVVIIVSFYPLAYISQRIAGAYGEVTSIVQGAVEPHEYEPTPRDIATIQSSRVFLYNGLGIDPWGGEVPHSNSSSLLTRNVGEAMGLSSEQDPHYWLDPSMAIREVTVIRDALIEADPQNRKEYSVNADVLTEELSSIDKEYQAGLSSCKQTDIVTSHQAFGYLAKRYSFTIHSVTGVSTEEEPSPKKISELTDLVRSKGIRYVLFESLTPPTYINTIAQEANVSTLPLNPIEGLTDSDIENHVTYLTLLRKNLESLRIAMECQ